MAAFLYAKLKHCCTPQAGKPATAETNKARVRQPRRVYETEATGRRPYKKISDITHYAFLCALIVPILLFTAPAHAQCANPVGAAGDTIYNDDHMVLQYCDDTNWIGMSNFDHGLVGHWKLDETSGTTAADSSPNNNTGTMNGGLDASNNSVTGALGNALDFDGTDDRISIANDSVFNFERTDPFTLAAWVYRDDETTEDTIFGKYENNINYRGYGMWLPTGNGYTQFVIQNTNSTNSIYTASNVELIPQEWTHVAATYDGSSTAAGVTLYINGVDVTNAIPTNDNLTLTTQNTGPLFIGSDIVGDTCCVWDGALDEARIYDRVLSASEIDALYDMGRDRGLTGHWKLDETGGTTTAIDSSPSGNNGTMNGGLSGTDTVTGKVGSALNFDGTDDYIPNALDYTIGASDDFTIAMWFRLTDPGFTSDYIFYGSRSAGNDPQFYIELDGDGSNCGAGELLISMSDDDGPARERICSNVVIESDVWYHIAAVYDDSANIITHINAVAEDTFAVNTNISGAKDFTTRPHAIGARNDNGTFNEFFNGDIDDVRVYDRALSQEEIQTLVENYVPGCSNPLGPEGAAIYNDDNDVMQYCNDAGWQAMGPAGDGGAGCSNPTGAFGDMIYNDDNNVMQYCEGDDWIAIGK